LRVGQQRILFPATLDQGERLVYFPGELPEVIPARQGPRRKLPKVPDIELTSSRSVTFSAAHPPTVPAEVRLVQHCPESWFRHLFEKQPNGKDAASDRRPNVLLIMTDDQGWGDVRSHGNDKIDTPVHDALALRGARFDRFYVSPLCAPTRASLLTGRYHLRTGAAWVTRSLETMRSEEVTIA